MVANPRAGRRTLWNVLTWFGTFASLAYLAWRGFSPVQPDTPWAWTATAAALLWLGGSLLWLERRSCVLRSMMQQQLALTLSEAQHEYARQVQQRIDTLNLEIQTRKALDQKLQNTLSDLYQQLASQRDFVAMVSHEFRTPISIIEGARQSLELLDVGQAPQAAIRLARIRRAVRRLTDLVGNLQTADRLDKDRIHLEFAQVSLAALAQRALAGVDPDQRVDTVILADAVIAGDASLLEIAITNLVGNALKYGGASADIRIEIGVEGSLASVSVMDRGTELTDAELTRIFERFYRGANTDHQPGTGLGLFLTQRIVELHGGNVRVERRPGGGNVFKLLLPQGAAAGSAMGEATAPQPRLYPKPAENH